MVDPLQLYSEDRLIRTKNKQWYLSGLGNSPNFQRSDLNIRSQWSVFASRKFVRIRRTVRIISAQINQSLLYFEHRFGIGRFTTEAEVDYTVQKCVQHAKRLREMR